MDRIKYIIALLFISSLTFGQGATPNLRTDLVLFTKMESISPIDEKGDHTLTNNGAISTTGKKGSALSFDGTNDRITVPHASSLNVATEITILAWIYISDDNLSSDGYIVIKANDLGTASDDFEYRFSVNTNNNNISGGVSTTGTLSGSTTVISSGTITRNAWNHVAMRCDGTNLELFINGTKDINSASFSGDIFNGTSDITIGARYDGSESIYKFFINGNIDELYMYNRALSDLEIKQHYNSNSGLLYVLQNFKKDNNYEKLINYIISSQYFCWITGAN